MSDKFNEMWSQYWSTFNEDNRFATDKILYRGIAWDFFEEQEIEIKSLQSKLKLAEAVVEKSRYFTDGPVSWDKWDELKKAVEAFDQANKAHE